MSVLSYTFGECAKLSNRKEGDLFHRERQLIFERYFVSWMIHIYGISENISKILHRSFHFPFPSFLTRTTTKGWPTGRVKTRPQSMRAELHTISILKGRSRMSTHRWTHRLFPKPFCRTFRRYPLPFDTQKAEGPVIARNERSE